MAAIFSAASPPPPSSSGIDNHGLPRPPGRESPPPRLASGSLLVGAVQFSTSTGGRRSPSSPAGTSRWSAGTSFNEESGRGRRAMLPALSVCITEKQQMDSAYDLWLKRNQIWTRRMFTEGRYMALFYFMYRDILLIACRQQMVWPLWHHELQHNIVSHCTAWYNLKKTAFLPGAYTQIVLKGY
ncbi:gastrotropin isoform 3-T9 [Ciconia maguari]